MNWLIKVEMAAFAEGCCRIQPTIGKMLRSSPKPALSQMSMMAMPPRPPHVAHRIRRRSEMSSKWRRRERENKWYLEWQSD
jgi:hypothetical protein